MRRYAIIGCLISAVLSGAAFTQDSTRLAKCQSLIDVISSSHRNVGYRSVSDYYDIKLLDDEGVARIAQSTAAAKSIRERFNEARRNRDASTMRELSQELTSFRAGYKVGKLSRSGRDFIAITTDSEEIFIPWHRIHSVRIEK